MKLRWKSDAGAGRKRCKLESQTHGKGERRMKRSRDLDILKISASSGMKLMRHALGFALLAALVLTWVISTIIESACDYIPSRLKERKDKLILLKRRQVELERLSAIALICTMSVLNFSQARYPHLSCAGIDSPNLGLNSVNGMLGISWFFQALPAEIIAKKH